jgi:peptidoglycan-associated lipoprotein
MRSKLVIQTVVLVAVAVLSLTGCKNPPWKKKPAPGGPGAETAVPPLDSATGIAAADRVDMGNAQRGQFAAVLFDYDSARIKPSEYGKLQAVATALKGNSKKLVVEGHCDERGTAEYNRALGERRAQATREELVKLGLPANRISTVSYGNEQPLDPNHDETAWSRNRRCEFAVVGS